jgi:hypothetical protein
MADLVRSRNTGGMGFRGQFALQRSRAAHVRFGSKADIRAKKRNVRFTESGHQSDIRSCPLCAKNGHWFHRSGQREEIESTTSFAVATALA